MSKRSVPVMLHDLVHHAQRVRDVYTAHVRTADFIDDETAKEAALWNFIAMGEVCNRLGDEFQKQHMDIPWSAIIDQRNFIAHGYDVLNWNKLVSVIENDLPTLIEHAQRLLDSYGPPPEM